MADKPLYSTAYSSADNRSHKSKQKSGKGKGGYQPGDGPSKMRRETKGRGGKTVTVIWNMPLSETEVRDHMKQMQTQFGCGATFKASEGTIELRGDLRDKVEAYFQAAGLKIQRAGG